MIAVTETLKYLYYIHNKLMEWKFSLCPKHCTYTMLTSVQKGMEDFCSFDIRHEGEGRDDMDNLSSL